MTRGPARAVTELARVFACASVPWGLSSPRVFATNVSVHISLWRHLLELGSPSEMHPPQTKRRAGDSGGAQAYRREDSRVGENWAFVEWQPHCSRSDAISSWLNLQMIRHYRQYRGLFTLSWKYLVQFVLTARDLLRVRPNAIICSSPSPLTALPVWLYCVMFRKHFAIDAHTAAFIRPRWDHLHWIQGFFCRRAVATFVTNSYLKERVEAFNARALILPDAPTETEAHQVTTFDDGRLHAVFAASFNLDEPLDILWQAARRLPGVTFHVTGRPSHPKSTAEGLLANHPENLVLTGFLSREDYLALLAGCDLVVALTTRDHTMQRAAYEAIYVGTPVLLSDWPVLRENFDEGALFVDNTVEDLVRAIHTAQALLPELRTGAERLKAKKLKRWRHNREQIIGLLSRLNRGGNNP